LHILGIFPYILSKIRTGSKPGTEELIPLEPRVREIQKFRQYFYNPICTEYKEITMQFDILTIKSLKQILLKSCSILVLSSDHYSANALSCEGELGKLDRIELISLKEILRNIVYNSQVKLIILDIPNSIELGNLFIELGVPHVTCFSFNNILQNSENEDQNLREFIYDFMYTFSSEFIKKLLNSRPVWSAFYESKSNLQSDFLKNKRIMLKPYILHDFDNIPILLPKTWENTNISDDPRHAEIIFESLKVGKISEISQYEIFTLHTGTSLPAKKNVSQFFVGREAEIFEIVTELQNLNNVNLYGKNGVGKSRLVDEICYFVGMRGIFKEIIKVNLINSNDEQNLKNCLIKIEQNSRILIIIDNFDKIKFQAKVLFLYEIQQKYKNSFLIISNEILENHSKFPMEFIKLKKFKEDELKYEFIIQNMNNSNKNDKLDKNLYDLLNIPKNNKDLIISELQNVQAFKQTNGNPKLLLILCQELRNTKDIYSIDLRKSRFLSKEMQKLIKNSKQNTNTDISLGNLQFPTMSHSQSVMKNNELDEQPKNIERKNSMELIGPASIIEEEDSESDFDDNNEKSEISSSQDTENESINSKENINKLKTIKDILQIVGPYYVKEETEEEYFKNLDEETMVPHKENNKNKRVTMRITKNKPESQENKISIHKKSL